MEKALSMALIRFFLLLTPNSHEQIRIGNTKILHFGNALSLGDNIGDNVGSDENYLWYACLIKDFYFYEINHCKPHPTTSGKYEVIATTRRRHLYFNI